MKNFFRIHADPACSDRWYLKGPVMADGTSLDPRIFTQCVIYSGVGELDLPIRKAGISVDFNFADFDMPVVSEELCRGTFGGAEGVQCVPVEVQGSADKYEILNVLNCVSCIDEDNSEFETWKVGDGRPDKVGLIRMVTRLRIDPSKASAHNIFRLREWPIALIVSDEIREQLQDLNVTGIWFEPLN